MPDIIDIHVHPVARNQIRHRRNRWLLQSRAAALAAGDPIALLLKRMAAGGISQACLLGPNPLDGIELTNEQVRQIVTAYPDRFFGFLGVDPERHGAKQTKAIIEQGIREWGFKGVGEIGGGNLLTPAWQVVFATCQALNVPVLIHTGIPLPSMKLRYSGPRVLARLAQQYPRLKIIGAHVGFPWVFAATAIATRYPNVYLDLSALPAFSRALVPTIVRLCLKRNLADRLLFGSDFPVVDPARYAQHLVRWPGLSAHTRRQILSGNARRLLNL